MSNVKTSKKELMANNQIEVKALLHKMQGEMARCLPKHLTPDRMTRIALTQLRTTPKLQECSPQSFIAAIMQASQLGLEPGVLGSCYLIPFWNKRLGTYECTFMPGYRGFLDLARRSGQIESLVARAVYENDEFTYEFGLKDNIIHKPTMGEKGDLICVYAVAILKDGGHQFDVMSKKEVDKIRDTSQSKENGPWVANYDEMAKKTIVRRLFKWLPCSVEMQKVISLDEQQEIGIQDIKASASEEFDMDFIDAEEASPQQVKQEQLMDKINSAKAPETGEALTNLQAAEISNLLAVKKISKEQVLKLKDKFNATDFKELTTNQAIDVISELNTFDDV